jgi:hypothetical protein
MKNLNKFYRSVKKIIEVLSPIPFIQKKEIIERELVPTTLFSFRSIKEYYTLEDLFPFPFDLENIRNQANESARTRLLDLEDLQKTLQNWRLASLFSSLFLSLDKKFTCETRYYVANSYRYPAESSYFSIDRDGGYTALRAQCYKKAFGGFEQRTFWTIKKKDLEKDLQEAKKKGGYLYLENLLAVVLEQSTKITL